MLWCSGALLLRGTGTSMLGTGTNSVLHVGTGTSICGTGTTASVNAPSHRSTIRGLTIATTINCNDLHSFFGHEPL